MLLNKPVLEISALLVYRAVLCQAVQAYPKMCLFTTMTLGKETECSLSCLYHKPHPTECTLQRKTVGMLLVEYYW